MKTNLGERLLEQSTIAKLLRTNDIFAIVALCVNDGWLTFAALLFWAFVLVVLIRRDIRTKSVSVATIVYGVLFAAIFGICVYALIMG